MFEIKLASKGNIYDLYTGCCPQETDYQNPLEKSAQLFLKKKRNGWTGLVGYDGGKPVGRVEFAPLEESFAQISGESLYFTPCMNLLPDYQRKGYGRKLMEELLRVTSDRKGVVTRTVTEGWMPPKFFERMGFEVAWQKDPLILLLYKHQEDAKAKMTTPKFMPNNKPNRVSIDVVWAHSCPYMVANYGRLIRKAKEFPSSVEITEHFLRDREDAERYGDMNIYVGGEMPFPGPASEGKFEKIIRDHLQKKRLV
ncbi:MAG: GNAT family N-acetyltransferase [candidate division Zixibacteria bacterium]|nr:GNAT family N-acetyltransferase [candidate division Zixibacteria bacterium]